MATEPPGLGFKLILVCAIFIRVAQLICSLVNLIGLIILLYEKVILFDLPYLTVKNYQFRLSKYDLVKNKMSVKLNTFAFLF